MLYVDEIVVHYKLPTNVNWYYSWMSNVEVWWLWRLPWISQGINRWPLTRNTNAIVKQLAFALCVDNHQEEGEAARAGTFPIGHAAYD